MNATVLAVNVFWHRRKSLVRWVSLPHRRPGRRVQSWKSFKIREYPAVGRYRQG